MRFRICVQGKAIESGGKKLIDALLHEAEIAPEVESAILKQIQRFGGESPDRVMNKPRLATGLVFFIDAFWDLDSERSTLNLDPIPWSKIVRYGEFYGLEKEAIEDLLYLIREADNAYLRRIAEKRKRG